MPPQGTHAPVLRERHLQFEPIVVAFYLRCSTKETAYAGLIWGFAGIWAFELGVLSSGITFGFLPFVPLLVSQLVIMALVTYATSVPDDAPVAEYERLFEDVW